MPVTNEKLPLGRPSRYFYSRGTWLVAAIVLLAVTTAGLNLAYHRNRAQAALAYFGPTDVVLIRSSKEAFLVRRIDGTLERRNISHVADLDDLQKALVEDASYRLPAAETACQPTWPWRLEFRHAGQSCTLEIDLDCGLVRSARRKQALDAAPIQEGMREFIDYALLRSSPINTSRDSE